MEGRKKEVSRQIRFLTNIPPKKQKHENKKLRLKEDTPTTVSKMLNT